jgi:GH25 family lysozyme M1 (1,4-beta-N-acetylmuramidase)
MAINRKVLDISKYQPTVNYAACAKDIDGVILRCGITYWGAQNKDVDSCFEKHYAGFKAQGVPVGVYYYSAADSVAQAKLEAQKCLEILKGKQLEYPVYFDMENNERQGRLTGAARYEIADAFLSTVEAAGYFVGFYSYSAFIQQIGTEYFNKLKAKYSIWLADYRKTPASYTRDMWQYTSSGTVAGISGRVDLSHCYKDFPTIIKKAGLNGYGQNTGTVPTPVADTLKVGDTVKVLRAIQYDNGRSFRTWFATYTVKQIKGNRVVIAKAGITVAAVHKDNLKKV